LSIAIPAILVIASLLRFWVDFLWFDELGQRDVIVTRLQWGTALGVAFGVFAFALLFGNFIIARRVARRDLYVPFLAGGDPEAPEQPTIPHYVLKPVLLGVATVGAIISGIIMSGKWEILLRFLGRSDFGVNDPQFGKDASFYVFTMPLLELITRSLQVLLVVTAIAVVVAYVATGVIRYVPLPRVARPAIVHLSWIVAAFLVVSAFQFRLSMWDLATSTRGVVAGAGWTDVHARIPGYWLMLVASVVLAGAVVMYARKERWRVVGGAIIGWVALSIIVTGLIPSGVQKVLVEPNELDREQKVLEGNIKNTRAAFDLGKIDTSRFDDEAKLSEEQLLTSNTGTTDNLRLWSPSVLGKVVNQEQAIRRYYKFNIPDIDRYTVDGDYRQVMVSVRELDPGAQTVASGWTNERLAFTHGYGAVATFPNEVTTEGKPSYLLKDLGLSTTTAGKETFDIKRPEVYFGEESSDYVIVGTKQREVTGGSDESGDDATAAPKTSRAYDGTGGIKVSGLARRIAFATSFSDARILFTGQLKKSSKILMRRDIEDRVRELAPFLEIDHDPYAVVSDGRVKWIMDAYTTSDRFPYSQRVDVETGTTAARSFNYVRNSVKAVVDAYDGSVTLYVADDKDPILKSWRDIFPSLFTPIEKMPDELRKHVRYPEDLFEMQTGLWKRYHMSDVAEFYQREDEWAVPTIDNTDMDGYYVLAKLPGETKEELLLIRPLTPLNRKNMVAYMAARSDGEHYGELDTLRLSTQKQTQGPSQVQALIKQDSDVARQVRDWTTGNNTVIFGDLLVLPVDTSLLYVQPVYLQNKEAEIPEFQKIVVVLGDTIAWGDTFQDAVESLLTKRSNDVSGTDGNTPSTGGSTPTDGTGSAPSNPTGSNGSAPSTGGATIDLDGMSEAQLKSVLVDVSAAYDKAVTCQRAGDTVCYAQQLEQVEQLLTDAKAGSTGAPETK